MGEGSEDDARERCQGSEEEVVDEEAGEEEDTEEEEERGAGDAVRA